MMSEEKEEKKILFVYVCAISKMMVNAKQVCTKSIDNKEESGWYDHYQNNPYVKTQPEFFFWKSLRNL